MPPKPSSKNTLLPKKFPLEYYTWRNIKSRVAGKTPTWKEAYTDRGIKLCKRWQKSFKAFLTDMGPKPLGKWSIERKDNDGNYTPSNCVWATALEQRRNCRPRKARIEAAVNNLARLSVTEVAAKLNLSKQQVYKARHRLTKKEKPQYG